MYYMFALICIYVTLYIYMFPHMYIYVPPAQVRTCDQMSDHTYLYT